jgi:hypothetical protein
MKRFNITKSNAVKLAIGGAAILSVVVVSTLAYMTFQTGTATNVFGVSSNINATLSEPSFDASQQASASDMVPGYTISKDPIVTNLNNADSSTAGMSEWASVQVQFTNGAGVALTQDQMALIADVLGINFDTTNWTPGLTANYPTTATSDLTAYPVTINSDGTVTGSTSAPNNIENFYYNTQLPGTGTADAAATNGVTGATSTSELFTTVNLNPAATNDQINAIRTMGGFNIVINGVATQVVAGDPSTLSPLTDTNAGTSGVTAVQIATDLNNVFTTPVSPDAY